MDAMAMPILRLQSAAHAGVFTVADEIANTEQGTSRPCNVELLTFTGLDAFTSQDGVAEMSHRHPDVEFGVIVGGHSGYRNKSRYPHLSVVEEACL